MMHFARDICIPMGAYEMQFRKAAIKQRLLHTFIDSPRRRTAYCKLSTYKVTQQSC